MKYKSLIVGCFLSHNAFLSEAGELRRTAQVRDTAEEALAEDSLIKDAEKEELLLEPMIQDGEEEELLAGIQSLYGGGGGYYAPQCPLYDTIDGESGYPSSDPIYPTYPGDGNKKLVVKIPRIFMDMGISGTPTVGQHGASQGKVSTKSYGYNGYTDIDVGVIDISGTVTSTDYPKNKLGTVFTSGTIRFDNKYWCYGSITFALALAFPPDEKSSYDSPYTSYGRPYQGSGNYYYYDTTDVAPITGGTGDFRASNGFIRLEFFADFVNLWIFPHAEKPKPY